MASPASSMPSFPPASLGDRQSKDSQWLGRKRELSEMVGDHPVVPPSEAKDWSPIDHIF